MGAAPNNAPLLPVAALLLLLGAVPGSLSAAAGEPQGPATGSPHATGQPVSAKTDGNPQAATAVELAPRGWELSDSGTAGLSTIAAAAIDVVVALRLPADGLARMHATLARGDPEARWSLAELERQLRVPAAARATVRRWIESTGGRVAEETPTGGFIAASYKVRDAEVAFGVTLRRFAHTATGAIALAAPDETISVPTGIASLVDFVAGLTHLPHFRGLSAPLAQGVTSSDGAGVKVNPKVIADLYSLPNSSAPSNNIQGIAAFNNESFAPADLAQFQKLMGLAAKPVQRTIGPAVLPKGGTAEGSLDVQYMSGVSPDVDTVVWATAGQTWDPGDNKYDNEPFLKWVMNVSATRGRIPNIFSISYQDFEDTLPAEVMTRLNHEFAALAMRGTTLVTGSGDWGVGCAADGRTFRADFPSSSPYVLSTGATTFAAGVSPTKGAEVGITFSSGGFSNHFAAPSFQSAAVERFLKGCTVPRELFNASGRAFPDVSAVGNGFQIVVNGKVVPVGGTSASSPTFGAVLSLINSRRLAAGKRTLGWVHPLLYSAARTQPSSFHDVVHGNNAYRSCVGFDATVGWDPMTGLGTPNFPGLLAQLLE